MSYLLFRTFEVRPLSMAFPLGTVQNIFRVNTLVFFTFSMILCDLTMQVRDLYEVFLSQEMFVHGTTTLVDCPPSDNRIDDDDGPVLSLRHHSVIDGAFPPYSTNTVVGVRRDILFAANDKAKELECFNFLSSSFDFTRISFMKKDEPCFAF